MVKIMLSHQFVLTIKNINMFLFELGVKMTFVVVK